jgi:hypothetical protein
VLIITIILFGAIWLLLDREPIDYVRTHFYNPSLVKSYINENKKDAEIIQNHITELQNKFASTLNETAVRSSFLYTQNAVDIYERSRIFGILLETVSGLHAVQFVDSNGIRIHYSTSARDIITQSSASASYRNYTDDSRALPFNLVSVDANESARFTMDDSHDRIIFSFPFFDSMNVYRGTAIFTLSVRALAEKLIAEGRLKPSDDVSVIRIPPGVVFGSPDASKDVVLDQVSILWNSAIFTGTGVQEQILLDAEESGVRYALISTRTEHNMFFGRLINNSIFSISQSMKHILQIAVFLTCYLTLYFLINIRPHPVTIVRNRIKTLRSNLFEELYVSRSIQERARWILELEQRRDEIRAELKYKLRYRRSQEKEIDSLINTAWDELLSVLKSGNAVQILAATEPLIVHSTAAPTASEADSLEEVESLEDVSALDEVDEIEEAEALSGSLDSSLDSVSEIKEEALDKVAVLDEVDEIEEMDEAASLNEARKAAKLDDIFKETGEEIEHYDVVDKLDGADVIEKIGDMQVERPSIAVKKPRGLLYIASKFRRAKETDKPTRPARGLLKLASSIFAKSKETQKTDQDAVALHETKGLYKRASEIEAKTNKGLLKKASKYYKPVVDEEPITHKGLLAMAREIEFNYDYPVTEEDPEQDFIADMQVVSPFASMFASLGKNPRT